LKLVRHELEREEYSIILIASENYVDADILAMQGCVLTNKYAEGYPSKRYYSGCKYLDEIENIAIERAKALFGADHANVQPHSGSAAKHGCIFLLFSTGVIQSSAWTLPTRTFNARSYPSFSGKWYRAVPIRYPVKMRCSTTMRY